MKGTSNARDWQTRIRLWSAIIVGVFQLFYMTTYAAGLVSSQTFLDTMRLLGPVWSLGPVFALALLAHASLGLWKLYRRHTLVMPWWEAVQIGLGLFLPFLILPSMISGLVTILVFQVSPGVVETILMAYPDQAWRYLAMVLIIGIHAQIGIHAVLRLKPWYPAARWFIIILTTLLPVAAAAGYLNTGNTLWQNALAGQLPAGTTLGTLTGEQQGFLNSVETTVSQFFLGLYGILFLVRGLRLKLESKTKTVEVTYPDGATVRVAPTTTILEASRIGGIPHASICGGRGRCTTCRVRVEEGAQNLSAVGDREQRALVRIGAAADIRLACQAEGLGGPVRITPLLPPDTRSANARSETRDSIGRDVELAVMFADLRGFTSLSEKKFPYDIVYILNSYFQTMGKIIEDHGGKVDKFMGDGILAYFGLDSDSQSACRGAVHAAQSMARNLSELNKKLHHVLPQGLSLGIGIHFGDLILGEVGFQNRKQLTIIGDTVNTASRLEALNKKAGSQLILSTKAAAKAGLDLSHLPMATVTPRGRTEPMRVYVVKDLMRDIEGTDSL